jgi:hypothetical protein
VFFGLLSRFAYLRLYGAEGPAFDGSWKPGDFEEVSATTGQQ